MRTQCPRTLGSKYITLKLIRDNTVGCHMKIVSKDKVVFSFSSRHSPVESVKLGELVILKTEDALGGQVKDEKISIQKLDWSKVNGATGPLLVEGAELGDTLVVDILQIKTAERGVIVAIPKYGVLGDKQFNADAKIVTISDGYVYFDERVRVKASPMIGTIGVAPEAEEIPSSTPGRHGGNIDVKELTANTRLYLPVFAEGALFAAGDIHAVQADGEFCVSAVEVAGQILLSFSLIKGKRPKWPILETREHFAVLTCADNLHEAAILATEAAVEALMREYKWSFEKAYMFGSIAIDLRINQDVDPKKGIRAVILKDVISLNSLLN